MIVRRGVCGVREDLSQIEAMFPKQENFLRLLVFPIFGIEFPADIIGWL